MGRNSLQNAPPRYELRCTPEDRFCQAEWILHFSVQTLWVRRVVGWAWLRATHRRVRWVNAEQEETISLIADR